jgi:putative transcriptional regulator
MRIGNNLRVWRAMKATSQQQLADSVGLSRQTVNSIERGKFVPSTLTALKLARHFETSVEQLFFLIEED